MRNDRIRSLLVLAFLGLAVLVGEGEGESTATQGPEELLLNSPATRQAHELVIYRLRDRVLAETPGGRRSSELFYAHLDELAATVIANPALRDLGASWIDAWHAPLAALVGGRGADLKLTQAQIDSLLDYVDALKEAANPSLRQALERETSRVDIPSWVGMTKEQWLQRMNRLSCAPSDTALCLNGGRFRVEAEWRTPQGRTGRAQAVPLTSDTGYFWFFGAANVEAVVKVLNACASGQRFWVFAAGLTNVEVDLTVADTWTGKVRTYRNPLNKPFRPLQDTSAFKTCSAPAPGGGPLELPSTLPPRRAVAASSLAAPAHACVPGPQALCLNQGRFRVETEWRTPQGQSGRGQAVPLTADTGYFWFFRPDNVEEVVKIHDGCGLNQRYWVFGAGLTNVRVVTKVTDTHTGQVRTYTNPQAQPFQPLQDTGAFATCPA